jgi:hypothetical protein
MKKATLTGSIPNCSIKNSGHQVSLFNLYVPVLMSEKKTCWDSLKIFLNAHNTENLIIVGDLNVTLSSTEKKGGSPVRDPAREWVEDLMIDWDLEDVKPDRGKYTWSNKRVGPGHIAARLDRFLVQSSFLTFGLMARSKILPNYTSDHKPILLSLDPGENLGPIPFRFSPLWTNQEGFQEVVSESWQRQTLGSPFFIWEEKLRRLKKDLKAWAKNFSSPSTEKIRTQITLDRLQKASEDTPQTKESLSQEADLQKSLHKACRTEEEYWRIKSRNLWLQAGDKNTTYFHKQAEARKSFNSVTQINFQGQVIQDFEGIKRVTHSYFKDLFTALEAEALDPTSYPLSSVPKLVGIEENKKLTAPISMQEIRRSLNQMDPDKAPGPDGFTARFYTSCWPTIQKDLLRMVKKSQKCLKLGGSTNSSFLALIPKEKGANNFSRFRPISLCNTGYKIITKIIANRLKNLLPGIILENQGGFIKGRHILDNIILVQEAIHSSCQRKEKGMIVKLDLANAFDKVRLDFLFAVMDKLGFGENFTNWVKACVSRPWIAPLVNGCPTDFFQASRGLRQGCPMSLLLYAIQASVLSFQLDNCLQNRSLSGIKMAQNVKHINHAQFFDDTLLLGGANTNSARRFKSELDKYKDASGSEISLHKSKIFGWNCTAREITDISRILGIDGTITWDSFKYLGVPLFKTSPRVSHWLPLLEKLKLRIQAWGANWLNLAGKVVLIKSVLTSLPLFQNSILLAPKTINLKIDQMMRRFLWEGGRNNERKLHLISWDKIKKPLLEGGLQIRDVATQNLAMGAKILWLLVSGKKTWSKRTLCKKYFSGQRDRCLERPPKVLKGSPIFSLLLRALEHLKENIHWIPGNGKKINIWEDPILGSKPLNQSEGMENIKIWLQNNNRKTLWDISEWEEGDNSPWKKWNLGDYPDFLEAEAKVLLEELQGKSPCKNSIKDSRGWGDSMGKYTAAAGYKAIQAIPHVPPDPSPWKTIWHFPSVPKIDMFSWTLTHKSALTSENLKKKGWEGPSRCPLCKDVEETADHLFIECVYTTEVWTHF